MTFTYRAITANCGNDSIGEEAAEVIAGLVNSSERPDFIIINCQEVDFEKTQQQLEEAAKNGYKVSCIGQMVTHTKPSTQLHSNTGIATFVIHKEEVHIEVEKSTEARRRNSRLGGSAYNKGGLVTHFKVIKGDEDIHVQAISGHLDSNNLKKRNHDWHNLHKAKSVKHVFFWGDLVKACPNMIVSGYDANTRNKLEDGKEVNLLGERGDDPEVQTMSRAALGERHFSAPITYSKTGNDIEDPKRPGYAARGSLDYLAISDGRRNSSISIDEASTVGMDDSTQRDHHVLISPRLDYSKPTNEFIQVRDHIAARLEPVAPELADKIRSLQGGVGDKGKLISVYNKYLSTQGLLNKAIDLHTQKLDVSERFMRADFLQDSPLKEQIQEVLFKDVHWCEGLPRQVESQQFLMHALLNSLKHCNHAEGVQARLYLYEELKEKIDKGFSVNKGKDFELNAHKMFRELAFNEFVQAKESLAQALAAYHPDDLDQCGQNFKAAGEDILAKFDSIQRDKEFNSSSHKTLDMLTRVAIESQKACVMVSSQANFDAKIVDSLGELSGESEKKSSPFWKGLGVALKALVAVASMLVGVAPAGLMSDKDFRERRLLKAVSVYKEALHDMMKENPIPNPKSEHEEKLTPEATFKY